MGLDINIYLREKSAHLWLSYSTIHILRKYASEMVGGKEESDEIAIQNFPNLIWHCDAEGYYVGFLPKEWSRESHLWVGSAQELYNELQRISSHMVANDFEGDAKTVLARLLDLFIKVEYNPEEDYRDVYIVFS